MSVRNVQLGTLCRFAFLKLSNECPASDRASLPAAAEVPKLTALTRTVAAFAMTEQAVTTKNAAATA